MAELSESAFGHHSLPDFLPLVLLTAVYGCGSVESMFFQAAVSR